MARKIYPVLAKGKTYYYYKESHRIKINEADKGKVKAKLKRSLFTSELLTIFYPGNVRPKSCFSETPFLWFHCGSIPDGKRIWIY